MRNLFVIVLVAVFQVHATGQPDFNWVKKCRISNSTTHGYSIDTDQQDNIYVAGYAGSSSYPELFMRKTDPGGNTFWTITPQLLGSSSSEAYQFTPDTLGYQYLFFELSGSMVLHNDTISATIGGHFIAKLTDSSVVWAKELPQFYPHNSQVITNRAGESFISSSFKDSLFFGDDTLYYPGTWGARDVYAAKLGTDGNYKWGVQLEENLLTREGSSLGLSLDSDQKLNVLHGEDWSTGPRHGKVYLSKIDTNGQVVQQDWLIKNETVSNFGTSPSGTHYIVAYGEHNNFITQDTTIPLQQHGIGIFAYNKSLSLSRHKVIIDTSGFYANSLKPHKMTFHQSGESIFLAGETLHNYNFGPFSLDAKFYIMMYDSLFNLEWIKNFPASVLSSNSNRLFDLHCLDTTLLFNSHMASSQSQSMDFGNGIIYNHVNGGDNAYYGSLNINCTNRDTLDVDACKSYLVSGSNRLLTESGTYIDTSFNSKGCYEIATINLSLNQPDDSVHYTNGLLVGVRDTQASYQWVKCDTAQTPIPGATNYIYKPNTNGPYALVINKKGCVAASRCLGVIDVQLSNPLTSQISLVPNPTPGKLRLKLPRNCENSVIKVFDSNGRLLSHRNTDMREEHLQLQGPPGLYFVKVNGNCGQKVLKVMKE